MSKFNFIKCVFILLLGFIICTMSCKKDSSGGGETNGGGDGNNPFVGTWTGGNQSFEFTKTTWEAKLGGSTTFSGTYTYKGNTATLTLDGIEETCTATISGNTMSVTGYIEVELTKEGGGGNASLDSWTEAAIPEGINELYSVAFGNGMFVAGDSKGQIIHSTDNGKTWGKKPDLKIGGARKIIYEDGKFICCGYESIAYASDPAGIWTIIDFKEIFGIYWDGMLRSITYGGGSYLLVEDGNSPSKHNILYSTTLDGPWTKNTTFPSLRDYFYDITYGNGKFVGVSADAFIAYATTPDGEWTRATDLPEGTQYYHLKSIIFDGSSFLAVGHQGGVWQATDPASWIINKTPSAAYDCIGYGKNTYVVAGGSIYYANSPSATWTEAKQHPFKSYDAANAIAFGNDTFVVVGGKIAYATVK
jgi:hypothetical protein